MSKARSQLRRLYEVITGCSREPSEEGHVDALGADLFAEDLSSSEVAWLDAQSGDRPDEALLEALVERRVKRVLGGLAGDTRVQLAPGTLQTVLESIAVEELDRGSTVLNPSDRPDLTQTTRPAHPAPGERPQPELDSSERVVLVTDAPGARELENSIPDARIHAGPRGDLRTEWTAARVEVVDAGETLAEIQRVMLWSIPEGRRQDVLQRAVRDSLVGAVLGGKYRILEKRGQGGFGTVYRAQDVILDVEVAVKVLKPRFLRAPDAMAKFLAEAQRLTAVDHPNIVRWITFDRTDDGLHYFVMEYLGSGCELSSLLRSEGKLAPERASALLLQTLSALARTHELADGSSLLHLDLKPQNIIVLPADQRDGERVKVIDFGISRHSRSEAVGPPEGLVPAPQSTRETVVLSTQETLPRGTLARDDSPAATPRGRATPTDGTPGTVERVRGGTPLYASPEQCKHLVGDAEIVELDGRTDLYSLGIIAFEMLTGEYPFPRPKSHAEAIRNHLSVPPRKVRDLAPEVPQPLADFVDRCLAKEREDRWSSADEAHGALKQAAGGRPRRRGLELVVALVLLAATALIAWRSSATGAPPAPCRFEGGRLAGSVVRLPVGSEDGPRIVLTRSPANPPRDPRLVDTEGAALAPFDVDWLPEENSFRLTVAGQSPPHTGQSPPDTGASGPLEVRLAWHDGEAKTSEPFEVEAVPALTWDAIAAPEPLQVIALDGSTVPGIGEAGSTFLAGELSLRVALATKREWLAARPVSLTFGGTTRLLDAVTRLETEAAGDEPAALLFVGRLAPFVGTAPSLAGEAVLTIEDTFGRETRKAFPLELTGVPTRLTLEEIALESSSGARQVVPGSALGAPGALHLLEQEEATLVVRGALGAPRRASLTASWQDVPIEDCTATWDGGKFELRVPSAALTESGTLKVVADETQLVRGPAGDLRRTAEQRLNLLVARPPSWTLALSNGWRTAELALDRGSTFPARPGRHAMHLGGGNCDNWSARFLRDGEVLAKVELERSGVELPLEIGSEATQLTLELSPPTTPAESGPWITHTCRIEVDASLALVPQEWSVDSDELRLCASEPLTEARWAVFPAGESVRDLAGRARRGADADGRVRLEKDDWAGMLPASDGDYVLVVEAADRAANVARVEHPFTVDEAAPVVEVLEPRPGRPWKAAADRTFPVKLRLRDGNPVTHPASLTLHTASGERLDFGSEVVWVEEAAWSRETRTGEFSARLTIPAHVAPTRGELAVSLEPEGKQAAPPVSVELAELPMLTRVVSESERDPAPMRLIEPPRVGSYLFGEDDLDKHRTALREHDAHWATDADYDPYRTLLERESVPELRIAYPQFDAYYLDEHEVSRAQYARFLDDEQAGYLSEDAWSGITPRPSITERASRHAVLSQLCAVNPHWPVDGVTWSEAWAYARWAGKRLPTYLEWEFAVRGPQSRIFATATPAEANLTRRGSSGVVTTPVFAAIGPEPSEVTDGFDRSVEGIWHLCGNVPEWTSTRYQSKCDSDWALTPFDAARGIEDARFWIVGADARTRYDGRTRGRADLPPHDFKTAEKRRHDFNAHPNFRAHDDIHVGFRCAVDARNVSGSPSQWRPAD